MLPDGPAVHVAFLAIEKSGCVIVGVGVRSAMRELQHLLGLTGCTGLITGSDHQATDTRELVRELCARGIELREHLIVDSESGIPLESGPEISSSTIENTPGSAPHTSDATFLLNSTSGTTGWCGRGAKA